MIYRMKLVLTLAVVTLFAPLGYSQVVFEFTNEVQVVTTNDRSEVRPWVVDSYAYILDRKVDCGDFFREITIQISRPLPTSQFVSFSRVVCFPTLDPTRVDVAIAFEAIDNRFVNDAARIAKDINNLNILSYKPVVKRANEIFTVVSHKTLLTEPGASPRLVHELNGAMRHHSAADFFALLAKKKVAVRSKNPIDIAQWVSNSLGRDVIQSLMANVFPQGNVLDITLHANYLFDDGSYTPVNTGYLVSRRDCTKSDTERCDGILP